jgi:L-asparaginase/Glu-tRNA(Gln) amidotransferase subunit D
MQIIFVVTVIPQIIRLFISVDVRNALTMTNGVKGIILVACGSSVTNEDHFKAIKGLVAKLGNSFPAANPL